MSTDLTEALSVFQEHWGHKAFRKAQAHVIESALDGIDVLAVLPTSYGKSACFQVPALMGDGCALVISPLIALMKDQVDDCDSRNIPATYVNSHVDMGDMEDRLDAFMDGQYKVFYIAPERISNRNFMAALKEADVSYIVVDEAHCVSRWGHDFRPMYSRIKEIVKAVSKNGSRPPIIAVTATATHEIEDDIAESLGMDGDYTRIVADPIRPNLSYKVVHGSPWGSLHTCVRHFDVRSGRYIVYVGTRNGAEKVAEIIADDLDDPRAVGFYHAGMTKTERERMQENFKEGRTPVIVATCAFGMGIDVPNIRAVVHFGIPGSLEDYVQESGRAGRDGKQSDVILLIDTPIHDDFSVGLRQRFLDAANPPYELFGKVWEWLHENLSEGEILSLAAAKIGQLMSEHFHEQIDGRAVGGVLNTLESYGLLRRMYMRGGMVIAVKPRDLRLFIDEADAQEAPEKLMMVTLALWELVKEQSGGNRETVVVTVDRATFSESCGMGELGVARQIKVLNRMGIADTRPNFLGKTVQIKEDCYGKDVDDILPKGEIVEKREREQRRLNKMLRYAVTEDTVEFIRNYFQKGK